MSYIEISQESFESLLTELGKCERVKDSFAKENIYLLNDNIKIYSSIVDGISRSVGNDAIRVLAWCSISNLPIKSSEARIYRVDTWAKNLRERIQKVKADIQIMKKCKTCDAFLVERINSKSGEKFWGCLNYKNHGKAINTTNVSNNMPPETKEDVSTPSGISLPPAQTPIFIPSKYQSAIFDFIQHGIGHGVIKAGAGCSKTTVIVMGTKYIPSNYSVLYLAFNVHIKKEIEARVSKSIDVRTFHSLGYMNVRNNFGNVEFNENKQRDIFWELVNKDESIQKDDKYDIVSVVHKLSLLIKANLMDITENSISELMDYHGIESTVSVSYLAQIVKMGIDISLRQKNVIDYSDEIYFPMVFDLKYKQYDYVFIDECQDTNKSQTELALKSVKPSGRIIAVGDEHQSILGFAGSDTTSIPSIIKRLNATVLPLSVSYRCPVSHVRLANKFVTELEARPNAPEGMIKNIDYNEFFDIIKPGDMVICRNNSPLVKPAFELLSHGIKVCIKGRDIGENLITLIKKFKTQNIEVFIDKLNNWRTDEITRCKTKGASTAMIEDKYEVLNIMAEDCKDVQCIINKIKTIFSDTNTAITFSSVHRAKGLESSTVFILEPSLMPSKHAIQEWEQTQEKNVMYVACTRSKDKLYFVSENGKEDFTGKNWILQERTRLKYLKENQ